MYRGIGCLGSSDSSNLHLHHQKSGRSLQRHRDVHQHFPPVDTCLPPHVLRAAVYRQVGHGQSQKPLVLATLKPSLPTSCPQFLPLFTKLFLWRGFSSKALQHLAIRTHRVASCVQLTGHQRPYFLTAYYHTSIKHTRGECCSGAESEDSWHSSCNLATIPLSGHHACNTSRTSLGCLALLKTLAHVSGAPWHV